MDNIYSAIVEAQASGQSAALCTVIKSSGSVPRHSTSKMLVFADGKFVGTVGGGAMEQRTIEEAKSVARSGQAKIVEYNLVDPRQGDPGVCGGTGEIFIEPIQSPPAVIIIGAGHVLGSSIRPQRSTAWPCLIFPATRFAPEHPRSRFALE